MAPSTPSLTLLTRDPPLLHCPSLRPLSLTPTLPPSPHMPSRPSSSTRATATTLSTSLPRPHLHLFLLPRQSLCTPPPPRPPSTSPRPPRSLSTNLPHPPSQHTSLHHPPLSQPTSLQLLRSHPMLHPSLPMLQPGLSTSPSPATSLLQSRLTMLLPPPRHRPQGPLTMSPNRHLISSMLVILQSTSTSSLQC